MMKWFWDEGDLTLDGSLLVGLVPVALWFIGLGIVGGW